MVHLGHGQHAIRQDLDEVAKVALEGRGAVDGPLAHGLATKDLLTWRCNLP